MTPRPAGTGGAAPAAGRSYWRSLERLYDSPPVAELLAASGDPGPKAGGDGHPEEFPEGASLPPGEVTRRSVLGLMGASFALAGLTGCRRPEEAIVPYVDAPEGMVPGIPRHYATTMPLGSGAYGVVVESHEGRPTKIEGNAQHPGSLGVASAWMQAAILDLYDPDRSQRPLRRAAAEGVEAAASEASEPRAGEGDHAGAASALEPAAWADFVAFWKEAAAAAEGSGGAGLAVLAAGSTSPTLARLAAAFRARWPQARWIGWEPLHDENLFRGLELATGRPLRPVYHLDRAAVVVALDADLLHTETDAVAHARGFAAARRPGGDMCRLYAVESTLTVTGGAADHRLRLKSGEVGAFALALAAELAGHGMAVAGAGATGELPEAARARAAAIAADLAAAGSAGLVAAGWHQPPEVHALAHAINSVLGAVGRTVTLHPPTDVGRGGEADLAGLVEAMRGGGVETLVVLGGNPVYDAPADLDFAGALSGVARVVHLSTHVDETSRAAGWHLPATHFLEEWGDARAADGTASVVQPLIAPLFAGSKSAIEVAGLLATGEDRPGHDLVRETWAPLLAAGGSDGDAEAAWRRVLHDGLLAGSAEPADAGGIDAAAVAGATARLAAAPSSEGLELTFVPARSVYDGRFANNGWLQEMPDPITRITWDNAALVSPATAKELGVAPGDVVRLDYRGRSLEAPAWVLPGQADGAVAIALGYGRTAAGRVGDGVGVDAYRLRTADAPGFGGGLTLTALGRRFPLSQTQEHWAVEGRELVREATLAEYRENPGFAGEPDADLELESLWHEREYAEGHQWGMSIDLNACIGCGACVIACQSENNVPIVGKEQVAKNREMQWLRVDRYFSAAAGDPGAAAADPEVGFQPMPCQQCQNAPCEQVCPVAATVHDREGLNAMVYNRCIGTRYCSNNCPYKVRRFNFFNYTKDTPELVKLGMNPDVTVRSRGVMEKCTYCIQRINGAKIAAKRAGREVADGDVRTACQQTCPSQAIVFGDLRDTGSRVAAAHADPRSYTLLAELNNKPRTTYQAKLRNPNPAWGEA